MKIKKACIEKKKLNKNLKTLYALSSWNQGSE